jgi:hypothetical protein
MTLPSSLVHRSARRSDQNGETDPRDPEQGEVTDRATPKSRNGTIESLRPPGGDSD